jgi:hypothetical protein
MTIDWQKLYQERSLPVGHLFTESTIGCPVRSGHPGRACFESSEDPPVLRRVRDDRFLCGTVHNSEVRYLIISGIAFW